MDFHKRDKFLGRTYSNTYLIGQWLLLDFCMQMVALMAHWPSLECLIVACILILLVLYEYFNI